MLWSTALTSVACDSSSMSVAGPSSTRCAITATANPPSVVASGSQGTLAISTNRECTWNASSTVEWISISAPTQGQGDATLRYAVTENAAVSPRQGDIVINGQRVPIQQMAASCVFALGGSSRTVEAGGDAEEVLISAQAGCAWNAVSQTPWIAITSGGSGNGAGRVSFIVERNPQPTPRSGSLMIANQPFAIQQAAAAGPTPTPPAPAPAPPTSPAPTPQPPSPAPTPAPTPAPPAPTPTPTPSPAPAPPPREVDLKGDVSDLNGRCPALTFVVKKSTVRTNNRTNFSGGACGDLREGSKVNIQGEQQADGSVLAIVVDLKD